MKDGFADGTLASLVAQAVTIATQTGALVPIATDLVIVHEDGLTFPVRVLGHFDKKLRDPTSTAKKGNRNPFLPYDPNLYEYNYYLGIGYTMSVQFLKAADVFELVRDDKKNSK